MMIASNAVVLTDGTTVVGVDAGTQSLKVIATISEVAPVPATFSNNLAAVSGFAKASPGVVKSASATNRNAAIRYLQIFNKTTAPVLNDVPIVQWQVSGTTIIGTDFFTEGGMNFTTGIAWGMSTTNGTYTAGTAADHDVYIGYT
jgi:hypothetical protein